jgi:hypothetical protein
MLGDFKKRHKDKENILDWLYQIKEYDQEIIDEIIQACEQDPECMEYYVQLANDIGSPPAKNSWGDYDQ